MLDDGPDYPIVPHEDVAEVDCCGCLFLQVRGDEADITCNECGVVIRTVSADQAVAVMESLIAEAAAETICSARCPHCGALNTFPGFSAIDAFVCSECGEGVAAENPMQ